MTRLLVFLLCCIFLCACTPTISQRLALADRLASGAGMEAFVYQGELALAGYRRINTPGEVPWVFIEGDGLAWITPSQPSMNPTPVDPVALRLAAQDPAANVIYLARPGQYLGDDVPSRYWLEARFAPEVVAAMGAAIRQQLDTVGTSHLYLVGYSGGGALAALLAGEFVRTGTAAVDGLVTVAGNLDHRFWSGQLNLTPLSGSLNPLDVAPWLSRVPQRHLVGTEDKTVPPGVQEQFFRQLGDRHCARLATFPLAHEGPWTEVWLDTREQVLRCP